MSITIEDFHIGFEYEELVKCHHGYGLLSQQTMEWKRRKYDFNSPKLLKMNKYIEEGRVREIGEETRED